MFIVCWISLWIILFVCRIICKWSLIVVALTHRKELVFCYKIHFTLKHSLSFLLLFISNILVSNWWIILDIIKISLWNRSQILLKFFFFPSFSYPLKNIILRCWLSLKKLNFCRLSFIFFFNSIFKFNFTQIRLGIVVTHAFRNVLICTIDFTFRANLTDCKFITLK